jgi:hypothetical protein
VGPFACQLGQSLSGTDDFAPIGCVPVPGPFGCDPATAGTDGLTTNGCIAASVAGVPGEGCAVPHRVSAPNEHEPVSNDGAAVLATQLPDLWDLAIRA